MSSRALLRRLGRLRGRGHVESWTSQLERMLDRLRDAKTRVVIAFSGDEPVHDELRADGVLARLDRWPNVVLRDLKGDDHTLRPIAAQDELHRILDAELDLLVGSGDQP